MLLGIKELLLGLSVSITQAIYPLIPRLYDLFLYTANFQILDNKFIHTVWNNIYILVGVVVLFAIAINLFDSLLHFFLAGFVFLNDDRFDSTMRIRTAPNISVVSAFIFGLTPSFAME